jgi:methyl-accepting chemotaxis protein
VAAAAEQMSANVMSVSSGVEQTGNNLTSVAGAAEQMTEQLQSTVARFRISNAGASW